MTNRAATVNRMRARSRKMKSVLQFAAILALIAVSASTTLVCWDTHKLATQAQIDLHDLDDSIKIQSVNLAADEQHLSLVMDRLDGTIDQLNAAAIEQRAYWQKTSADSDKTVKALRVTVDRASLLLDHTDKQLNSFLLPDLDRSVDLTSAEAQLSLASFTHAGDALTWQLDDPAISSLAQNLNEASAHVAESSAHLERTTADIEQAVHRVTRPPSLAKRIGMGLLDVGAKLGSIAAGFVR